jgi:hypothetical protein
MRRTSCRATATCSSPSTGPGTVGGVNFTAEDVLEFTPTSTGWALSYDGLAQHSGWVGAELHGLSAVTDPPPTTVPPQFDANSGGGEAGSGLYPGSTRVFGMGMPNAVPGNSCIAIYAVGPNGRLDNPPGSGDDQLLGTGGINASGLFVDAMGNPGIAVAPSLRLGERLIAVDVCQGLIGPLATVSNRTLAPTASPLALALLAGLLTILGVWRLRVRR